MNEYTNICSGKELIVRKKISSFIEKFLSIGVDELSVSPSYILSTRKKITEINISEIKDNILKNI